MFDGDLATSATSQKGALPDRNLYDIHCQMIGGPDYRLNYLACSCLARQLNKTCTDKKCERRVNLVRPGLIQLSVATTEHIKVAEEVVLGKKPVRVCLHCEMEMSIVARGLCGACMARLKKLGTLDEKYPSKRAKKPTGVKCTGVDDAAIGSHSDSHHERFDAVLGPIGDNDTISVLLEFKPKDRALFEALDAWAIDQRRELEDQLMFVLDNIVAERTKDGM